MSVRAFIRAAHGLGAVRFVAVAGSGSAVLEAVGRFDYSVRTFSVAGRGEYVTLASDDGTFECHLNVSAVASVTLSVDDPKIVASHKLYVVRFRDARDAVLLSALLAHDARGGPGSYAPAALAAFHRLRETLGDRVAVAPPPAEGAEGAAAKDASA